MDTLIVKHQAPGKEGVSEQPISAEDAACWVSVDEYRFEDIASGAVGIINGPFTPVKDLKHE